MNILQLIPNISGGGAERLVVDLCNELSSEHEVSLLTLYDPREKDLFREELSKSVGTYSIRKKPGPDWKIVPRLYKAIRQIQPDVIHNHLRSLNYLMPLLPFLKQIPVVHTIHSDAFKECPSPKIRKLRKFFFERDYVIPATISGKSARSFIHAYGDIDYNLVFNGRKYPEKSEQFDQVVKELNIYKKNSKTKIFVNIGRISPEKNQLMLVEAFNKLSDEGINAVLVIIGGGRDMEKSQKIQQQLEMAVRQKKNIYMLSERPNATDYLYAADFFCLTSIFEGMPITLIEAFATGCIPLCTPVGGIPEMVSELDPSLLSKSGTADDYYRLLKKGIAIPKENYINLKSRAIKLYEKCYSIEHCAQQYLSLYTDLLTVK